MATRKQIEANRRNRQKWRLTDEGRRRLRESALARRPWEHSTGPRTAEGKARMAENPLTHGRETAERRAWRQKALRFIRLSRRHREALAGLRPEIDVAGLHGELGRLAAEIRDECPPMVAKGCAVLLESRR